MDVDAVFPNLSALVQSETKQTLNQHGVNGKPTNDDYWNLKSSCWAVLNDRIRGRGGPHQTLKTLDEFIRRLPSSTSTRKKKSIANKICSGSQGSQFLDTAVEAAWALHYWENGIDTHLEEPLNTSNIKKNNADLVITLKGTKYWLDAISVKLSNSKFHVRTSQTPLSELMAGPSKESVLAELAYRAKNKYREKFGEYVHSGLFKGDGIVILLCVFKAEEVVLPVFDYSNLLPPPAPEGLFDDESSGLNLVIVHTLDAKANGILYPHILAYWLPGVS